MNAMKIKKILIALIISASLASTAAHSQYYLGVIRGETKKIPLVVLDVFNDTGDARLRALAVDILETDLRRSQVFDVLDPKKLDLALFRKSRSS